ncbi:MAG TPA: nucleotidyltransferase substrate binding protein [Chitinophagales bacterium]|nr:nucleotidyltransferase substrate binding protein [Chitinophagales bacterium]
MTQDIRWQQRLSNYSKALKKLGTAIDYIKSSNLDKENKALSDLIKQGLIQSFEYTHELAWNVIKDYSAYQGNVEIRGSRDAAREAFSMGIISNGEVWMEMIKSRNKTSHTYNEETANEIFNNILNEYYPAFLEFHEKMDSISRE